MVYTTRLAQGGRQAGLNAFETLLKLEGITQKNGRPYKPTTQGKIERFWQTLKKYLTQHPARTIPELQRVLDEFVTFYNESRPHRALGRKTPAFAYEFIPKCLAGALGSVDVTIGKCERAYLEAVARSHFWLSWRCRRRGGGACWGRRVARVPRSRRSGSELTPRLPRRGAICTSLAGRIARSRRSSLVPRGRRGC